MIEPDDVIIESNEDIIIIEGEMREAPGRRVPISSRRSDGISAEQGHKSEGSNSPETE